MFLLLAINNQCRIRMSTEGRAAVSRSGLSALGFVLLAVAVGLAAPPRIAEVGTLDSICTL